LSPTLSPVMVLVAFAFPSLLVAQENKPLITRERIQLNLAGAETILKAAKAKAESMGLKSNIAVVDDGGHLLAFARMDGARPASVTTALAKATSAATVRQETGTQPVNGEPNVLLSLALQGASNGKFTPLKGGIPIVIDGQVVGAVGVGGGSGEQDAEVAKAGVKALLDALGKK
jgi:glc operon protein GlcG